MSYPVRAEGLVNMYLFFKEEVCFQLASMVRKMTTFLFLFFKGCKPILFTFYQLPSFGFYKYEPNGLLSKHQFMRIYFDVFIQEVKYAYLYFIVISDISRIWRIRKNDIWSKLLYIIMKKRQPL